mgnify:CR=1 FL=1
MSKFHLLVLFLFIVTTYHSQSTWEYYSDDRRIQDIQVVGDDVWIGNPTGLHIIDIETGEGELLQSFNSDLKGSSILQILPTEDYVWIALSQGGIARYTIPEGNQKGEWKQFYILINGIENPLQKAGNLIAAEDGTLWFFSRVGNYINLFSIKGETQLHHPTSMYPYYLFENHGSQTIYYVDYYNQIHYYDIETEISTQIPKPPLPANATNFHINGGMGFNGELYLDFTTNMGISNNRHFYRYNGSWNIVDDIDHDFRFYSVSASDKIAGSEKIWVNSSNNFISISPDTIEYFSYEDIIGDQYDSQFRYLIFNEDAEGRLWLAKSRNDITKTNVISIKDGVAKDYNVHHSFLRNSFTREDETELFDFDCNGNLLRLEISHIQVFHPDSSQILDVIGNYNGGLANVATDQNTCRYYVAHNLPGINDTTHIYVFEDNDIIDTLKITGTSLNDHIHVSNDGKLYFATSYKGVGVYNEIERKWDFISEPYLNYIKESVNGILSFRSTEALITYDNGLWTTFDKTNTPQISHFYQNSHLVDSNGDVLMYFENYVNDDGIYKFDGTDWEFTSFEDVKDGITCIYEDEKGNYLMGTRGSGLIYWNGIDYKKFDITNSDIPSNYIYDILLNPVTDDLWLLSNDGIIIFDLKAETSITFVSDNSSEPELYSVFPNPSEGQFTLKSNIDRNYNYKVFNSEGQFILGNNYQFGNAKFEITTSGLYFLQVNDGQSNQVSKIIVH